MSFQSAIRLRPITLSITVVIICLGLGIRTLTRPSSALTYGGRVMALGLPISQDFDSIGTSATAMLPADFRADRPSTVRTVGAFTAAGTTTTQAGGANLSTTAANGIYNFGSGITATGPDRAIGFLSSGGGTQSGNLYAQIVNNTGGALSGLLISYDVEKYRNGSNAAGFGIQLYYSTDGTTWTSAGNDFLTSFAADANNNGFMTAPGVTVSVSNKTLNALIPNGGDFYLAWNYSVASGTTTTNAQALAIDNIAIQGAAGSTPPSGVGGANPNTVAAGGSTLLSVVTTPGTNPTSTGITVTGDLTAIGGSVAQAFFDDGSNGDGTSNDGVFSLQATVDSGVAPGAKSLPFTVSDAQGRTSPPAAISLTVQSITPTPTPVPGGTVVISQVYGGGGNTGATLKNDFIEIINHTDTAINLSGWSVQYASATDQNWQVTPLTNFMLSPGQYYLIKEAPGAGGTVDLPTPDATGSILMGAVSGKVALVSNTVALTGLCPSDPAIIDFAGYGDANCFEGSGATPALTNTTAALRGLNGCLDTNNNAGDFGAGPQNPRNSSSPTNNCAILSGVGSANPNSVAIGETTTLTVQVFPAPNPPSTGISVVADLSSIGGAPNQPFNGAGNIFTFNATVAVSAAGGMKSLPVTITDDQARSGATSILLTVRAPHVVISQLYGGGGNNNATFTNDYVELYNPTDATVTITGWSLQYTSAAGTTWTNIQPIGGAIAPGEYYLVSLASGGANGAPLPVAPNISGGINMAAGAGKIALVRNSGPLSGSCPIGSDPDIVDFVGYGTTASCKEGSANAPAPSNTTAIFRINNGQTDTDQNGADFIAAPPNPRRTAPIVELGPWVAITDPITNDTNTPHDATVSVDFSEPVDVSGAWYYITCSSTGQHNSATVASYNGSKGYHITPNAGFQFGETCTVTIFKDQVHDKDLDDSLPDTDTLFENYTWSFTVVGAGDPAPFPPSVHLTMGNPSNATPSVTDPNNYLMEKPTYSLSYNRDKGIPNWVSWHLDQSWIGTLARDDTFRADPAVPPDWYRVQSTDYSGSGFDRGHMTPNADRDYQTRIPINQETFLMSNMVPQSPDNNQGPWAGFEEYLRAQLPLNGEQEMYVISGPLGVGGSGSNGGTTNIIAGGHVTVPAYTWKVVLVLPKGDDDVSRASCSSRTIAVLMPNIQGIRNDPWEIYLTRVDVIEALTGYDFFSNLPEAVQNCVEAGTDGTNPPGTANQSANTTEDAPVTITLRAALPNNNTPTFSIVGGGPAQGSLGGVSAASCVNGDCAATVTYTPGPDYNGGDSFNFKVNDGNLDSNVSTVSVNITSVNDPPVAANDSKSTSQDMPLNFPAGDLTANDVAGPANENGQALTVTGVNATANTHGTVELSGGMVIYSPDANFSGLASFDYQVCDNGATNGAPDSRCAVASVNVSVALTSLVGLDCVKISGAAYADSYDSKGGYPATKGALANSLSNGTITIAGSGKVWGSVRSTQAGVVISGASKVTGAAAAGTTVSRSGNGSVGGTITNNALTPLVTLPAVAAWGPAYSSNSGISGTYSYNASMGDLTLSGVNVATLANGTYCFRNVTLTHIAQLKVNGPVVIKLTGALNIGGASNLSNTTGIPGNLRILSSYNEANGVTIYNVANNFMVVYAPQTEINISGTGRLFGSVVGKTITVGYSGAIHYDTGLEAVWPDIWSLIFGPLP